MMHVSRLNIRPVLPLLIFLPILSYRSASAQPLGIRVGPQVVFLYNSARAAGLGDASLAMIDDFGGYGSSPSTLGFYKKTTLDYSFQRVTKGITLQHVGFVYSVGTQEAIALNYDALHFGGINFITDRTVRQRGFESRIGLSYGRKLGESVSTGVTMQVLNATTDVNPVWAVTGDIGFTYVPSTHIRYALALRGLGSDYRLNVPVLPTDIHDERTSRVLAFGIVFDYPLASLTQKILITMQNEKILGREWILYRVGFEYTHLSLLGMQPSARFGFLVRGAEFEPRGGLGLAYGSFALDYAYRYSRRDGGPSQFFGFTIEFR